MTANTPSLQPGFNAKSSRVKKGVKIAGLILRLAGMTPGLLFKATRGYRRYEDCFVKAAVEQGMPRELALALAQEVKPVRLLRGINTGGRKHRKDAAGQSTQNPI